MGGISIAVIVGLCSYRFLCMRYMYKLRGNTRFDSLSQYLRKGVTVFAPTNCLLYMATKAKARGAILDTSHYEDLKKIKANWTMIRDEAMKLYQDGIFDQTVDPDSAAYYDVGFRTFYKYGWSKFYLSWYGYVHNSARRLCPRTSELLSSLKSINGAMFSILPPGSKLTPHCDPIASSLRYHLGLMTPNNDQCYINVDGHIYSWRDGKDFLFDETYIHFVNNHTDNYRLILMCDVNRPTSWLGSLDQLAF